MPTKKIRFVSTEKGPTAIFRTDHGRRVLLTLKLHNGRYFVEECRYVDRTKPFQPQKVVSVEVAPDRLSMFLKEELDTTTADCIFCDEPAVTALDLIQAETRNDKPKILIFLREGRYLKTIFKNRFRRTIQLTLKRASDKTLLDSCYYVDKRDAGNHRIPHTLVSIECGSSAEDILAFVNDELEGGFTHILIADEHNIDLTENTPICGAI